jgi:DNA-binding SARP family transcriptional activator
MDEFWPNASLAQQRSRLNTALHSIRKQLGANLLLREGDAITVRRGDHLAVDVEEFEHLALEALGRRGPEETSIEFLAAALELYKGPYLPGRRREWAIQRRRHLERLFLRLALAYGNRCLSLGRGEQALGAVMSALDADPYDERIRMLAASILSAVGRGVQAMHLLTKYSELLEAENLPGPSEEFAGFERLVLSGYPVDLVTGSQEIAVE